MMRMTHSISILRGRRRSRVRCTTAWAGLMLLSGLLCSFAGAQVSSSTRPEQEIARVGVEERLGDVLPLGELTFTDEEGREVRLKDLVDRPVALTLIYLRCPGICSPLLNEVARFSDLCDLEPGKDYRLISISFDPSEGPDLARRKKENMLKTFKHRTIPSDGWRFLVGDERNIKRISDAVGFYYVKDKNGVDFVHATAVMFISPEGKISRYLTGVQFNPPDWKMAILDASEGRTRSFMEKVQQLCYSYDPASRSYVLALNRIILGVTVVIALVFVGFLLRKGGRPRPPAAPREGDVS